MSLYRKHYRVESARADGWDYASSGWYFVTICTYGRVQSLGRIVEGRMVHSRCGEIVAGEWQRTSEIRSSVVLDEWIVMPNHLHGIVVIDSGSRSGEVASVANRFGPQRSNLASIIRGFKAAAAAHIYREGIETFAWQAGYHDRIIRNQRALERIRRYIIDNPTKWEVDRNRGMGVWI